MRITNKIIRNNSLNNVNYNKNYMDKLNTQMATEKKINRPSDDPVVAIRALRLRSDVTEVTQYYSKNIPDAKNWLSVTEGALSNLAEVITDMYSQCTKGSSGELTTKDRQIILESLKALRTEVYTTGDADYAGRYVFTGYRTDVSLSFPSDTALQYNLTEQADNSYIDSMVHVKTTSQALGNIDLKDINETNVVNYTDGANDFQEQDVESVTYHRLRMSYKGIDDDAAVTISYKDETGTTRDIIASDIVNSYDFVDDGTGNTFNPYELINTAAYDNKVICVKDTGELLLGKNVYATLQGVKDDPATTAVDEGEIRVNYNKTNWVKGDLRPEHYFACKTNPGSTEEIVYNDSFLSSVTGSTQLIEYDVGFNQTVRVNSTADECFNHNVGRDVEDLILALENTMDMEEKVTKLKDMVSRAGDADKERYTQLYDAANKAYSLLKDSTQKLFERGITRMQQHLDAANLSVTNNGTRSKKLSLIETRMQSQKTTFETLKSENEDIDIADVTIELASAQTVYDASLMASAKVMKASLLDYI